jgi:nucleotide-binding universal stress UspA family protein
MEVPMKSIIVHSNDDDGFSGRLSVALDAARALDAHLTCLQVAPFQSYVTMDPFGGAYFSQIAMAEERAKEEAFRLIQEERLNREDVRWDWQWVDGDPASVLVSKAMLADLVVISQYSRLSLSRILPLADQLVVNSNCATLVVPDHNKSYDPTAPIVIGWNATEQAARAVRQALPLIALSSAVHLVSVDENEGEEGSFPETDISSYLSRYGVSTELTRISRNGPIDQTLTEFATSVGASALVIGAYGHSRVRETLMGGVTKRLLSRAKIPLILSR